MSFQKFMTLVALVAFASQGAMAIPSHLYPPPRRDVQVTPTPQSIGDTVLGAVGHLAGTIGTIAPSDTAAAIKASGGTPGDVHQSLTNDLLTNGLLEKVSSIAGGTLSETAPSIVTDQAIKGAGGTPPDEVKA